MADDERQLCPDGGCIGIIGPDGRCKECGLSADAEVAEDDADHDDLEPEDHYLEADDEDYDEDLDEDYEDDDEGYDEDEDYDEDLDEDEDYDDDDEVDEPEGDLDLSHRELCPDGDCIGVIGTDGRCKECGTPGRSSRLDPRQRALRTDSELEDEIDEGSLKSLPGSDPEFDRRQLCPDGACVGIIGADGRCKECGRTASKALE